RDKRSPLERGPSRPAPQAAPAARRVAPPPPQRGCSRVGHFTCRDGGYAISMGPGRQAGTARER
ncbi:MAG: hypothetical protein AAF732_15415, partial [Pseudomonadota bacterium]